VADAVRGLSLQAAETQLKFMNKEAAVSILKLLQSAVANATHNEGLSKEGLSIVSLVVDGGPILYRYRPRAMGRAATIRKRTTHVTVLIQGEK
jgi:large subunit ribosomal protein L22